MFQKLIRYVLTTTMEHINIVVIFLSLINLWPHILATTCMNESLKHNDEKKLLDKLMFEYDRDVRPVRNATNPIVIKLSITLTQIFDMDEKNQVLTTNVWLDQEWYDELLTWDPAEFNGLDTIRLPCDRIWLPDIVLYNNADDYTRGYMKSKAMVRSDGNVFWPPPTKFRSTCPVDVTYFPFDDQTCILKLGSWMYDGFQVDVTNRTSEVDLSNYVPSGEWELMDARIVRNVMYYSCCPEPFPDVTITLVMRRKTLYYMYNVVLPCMMMSILTLLVFCLPPDSGEKIGLGITVLLAFSVFMLAIAEKMPETSESIPLIGIYLTTVMGITSISVIMTVIVLNFHHRGPIKKEVPNWMRRLILEQLAACTRVKTKTLKTFPDYKDFSRSDTGRECPSNACNYIKVEPLLRLNIDNLPNANHLDQDLRENAGVGEEFSSTESLNNINMNDLTRVCHKRSKQNVTGTATGTNGLVQDEILKALKYMIAKQEDEEHNLKIVNEWRQIATVLDRFLFWIFFVVTLVSSVSFLVIIPLERRGFYG